MKEYIPWFQDVFPWIHRAHILSVCLLNKCEISNRYYRAMTRFGIKPCHKKSNQFQFQFKICVCPFKYRPSIISMHTKREVGVQISKRRCTLGSHKGEVARLHTIFFCQKTVCFCFENIFSPSQCRDWFTQPLAADISCCLTGCSIVFYAKQTTTCIGIFV